MKVCDKLAYVATEVRRMEVGKSRTFTFNVDGESRIYIITKLDSGNKCNFNRVDGFRAIFKRFSYRCDFSKKLSIAFSDKFELIIKKAEEDYKCIDSQWGARGRKDKLTRNTPPEFNPKTQRLSRKIEWDKELIKRVGYKVALDHEPTVTYKVIDKKPEEMERKNKGVTSVSGINFPVNTEC